MGSVADVVITSGQTTPASVTLGPKTDGGNGTFSYTITVPSGAGGTLTVTTSAGTPVAGGTADLTAGQTTYSGTLSLAPGCWR